MFVHLASFSALRAVIINSCRSQEPKQSHQKVRLRCQIATATRELSRQVSKQRQPVTLKSSLVYLPVNQGMKLVKFSNLIINNELIIRIQFPPTPLPPPILFSCKVYIHRIPQTRLIGNSSNSTLGLLRYFFRTAAKVFFREKNARINVNS